MASGAAQALLHVVWGALSPPGAGRWYFLLALRLLALAFARGAWRGPPHDLLCTWAPPGPPPPPPPPGLRRLCAALCYNRHFPAPMASLWSLSFLLALLPITLLRLLHPPGHARRGAEGGDHPNMAAGGINMAARGDNMVAGGTNVSAGHNGEGGAEGSGGEDKMATRRQASGRNKMAAWPRPSDESSALMWMDELDAVARPRPSRESNMAAGRHLVAKAKMAASRHPANESNTASRGGESNMAARRCLPDVRDVTSWNNEPRPAARPCLPAASNMAARRRPIPAANMADNPSLPALPALPVPGSHDGRGRWRVWLGAAAAAMLAVGEGGFLWAVLWRQLPTLTAVPIGCHLPTAPCPPLACALPARADKMAALLGIAASAAVSLIAVMAAAIMAAVHALRGRGRQGEGPV